MIKLSYKKESGIMIERIKLWLKKNKSCSCCCLFCKYVENCKKELL